MKPLVVFAVLGVALAAGCATPQTYRQRPGAGPAPIPDTTPSLGAPAESFDSRGPAGGPADGGPSLGMPEAWRDDPPLNSPRAARGRGVTPQSQKTQYRGPMGYATPTAGTRPAIAPIRWSRAYFSADQRAVESCTLGRGPRRVAVLASLHGDEKRSQALVENLADELRKHPDALADVTVLVVRNPNPDGLASGSPYNRRGVDLNRNFPADNWRNLAAGRGGTRPDSEIETRELGRLLREFRPDLVIHVKDGRGQGLLNVEGESSAQARLVADRLSCRVVEGLGAKTSGSLEHFSATELHAAALTLLLPRTEAAGAANALAAYRDALCELIAAPAAGAGAEIATRGAAAPADDARLRPSVLKRRPGADPEFKDRAVARQQPARKNAPGDLPTAVPDRGYFELPPP